MKLIIEEIYDSRCFTEESEGKPKALFIEGPFLVGNAKNKNNRIYPWDILEEKADNYIKDYVNTHRAYGELGHPEGPRINPERISHLITSLTKDGTRYIGKARINEEGLGKIAHGIVDMGGMLGVSSRALGSLKENADGVNEVQKDLRIATAADIVIDPSAPGAFVNGIYEGADFIFNDNGTLVQKTAEKLQTELKTLPTAKLNPKTFMKMWEEYCNALVKIPNL